VTYSAGYAGGLRSHFDRQLQVVNLSRGGRTTATFRSDGRWQQMLDLKPDYVLIQFGHNDEGVMTPEVYGANLGRYVDEARAAESNQLHANQPSILARRWTNSF
jgi:lysophospholipase L1-like esterase